MLILTVLVLGPVAGVLAFNRVFGKPEAMAEQDWRRLVGLSLIFWPGLLAFALVDTVSRVVRHRPLYVD